MLVVKFFQYFCTSHTELIRNSIDSASEKVREVAAIQEYDTLHLICIELCMIG